MPGLTSNRNWSTRRKDYKKSMREKLNRNNWSTRFLNASNSSRRTKKSSLLQTSMKSSESKVKKLSKNCWGRGMRSKIRFIVLSSSGPSLDVRKRWSEWWVKWERLKSCWWMNRVRVTNQMMTRTRRATPTRSANSLSPLGTTGTSYGITSLKSSSSSGSSTPQSWSVREQF